MATMKVVFVYKDAKSPGIESLSAALKHHGHVTSVVCESFLLDSPRIGVFQFGLETAIFV